MSRTLEKPMQRKQQRRFRQSQPASVGKIRRKSLFLLGSHEWINPSKGKTPKPSHPEMLEVWLQDEALRSRLSPRLSSEALAKEDGSLPERRNEAMDQNPNISASQNLQVRMRAEGFVEMAYPVLGSPRTRNEVPRRNRTFSRSRNVGSLAPGRGFLDGAIPSWVCPGEEKRSHGPKSQHFPMSLFCHFRVTIHFMSP
ncbi:MAG: hypothetical protein JWM04_724 [Verrucomicrobiales bacterium]|nr:hypothetical protein [Verrucomicrobiales bacterium]